MSELLTEKVFCDWLDFTLPVSSHDPELIGIFFQQMAFVPKSEGLYRSPAGSGSVKITKYGTVIRVSISGSALGYIRSSGNFDNLLSWLSDNPHHITRFDAALDKSLSGSAVIKSLKRKHRTGTVKLSQRALPVTTILTNNDHGELTGTFYVGHRSKAGVTARVYDKQFELFQKSGLIVDKLTRYEITVRGDRSKKSPCLRDLYDPTSIFWEFASPALLKKPAGVPEWNPTDDLTFIPERIETAPPYVALSRFIETSGLINTLSTLASKVGPYGQAYALKMIKEELQKSSDAASVDLPNGILSEVSEVLLPKLEKSELKDMDMF